ncbi:hypothetical protein J4410_07735 [Candidatus Woesearchaeota archaeon]|nr:hypothetical protein [Candidatus Woesearchaeota archaeon]
MIKKTRGEAIMSPAGYREQWEDIQLTRQLIKRLRDAAVQEKNLRQHPTIQTLFNLLADFEAAEEGYAQLITRLSHLFGEEEEALDAILEEPKFKAALKANPKAHAAFERLVKKMRAEAAAEGEAAQQQVSRTSRLERAGR